MKYLMSGITCLLFLTQAALAQSWEMSKSIAESQKKGIFVKPLLPEPSRFDWEGHHVTVAECWLEKSGLGTDHLLNNLLLLKFMIDGKTDKEVGIGKHNGVCMQLKVIEPNVSPEFQPIPLWFYAHGSALKSAFGDFRNRKLYWARVPCTPEPVQLKMQIGTLRHLPHHQVLPTSWSSTILTFELTSPKQTEHP